MERPRIKPEFILVTGLSGAGKSQALNTLEDLGFFCVDNLPLELFRAFIQEILLKKNSDRSLAIGMDARDFRFFKSYDPLLKQLKKYRPELKTFFLTASETTLIRRFSETRRSHPLAKKGNLVQAIREEKKLSQTLKESAEHVIDTSYLNIHALRAVLENLVRSKGDPKKIPISFVSFGYRHGIPPHCDLVFDVRFLPNPYFVSKLKNLDGNHRSVQNFVLRRSETQKFSALVIRLLDFLVPQYIREGKSYLTVAFGCTGGKHRSVSLANYFKAYYGKKKLWVSVEHRDIHR